MRFLAFILAIYIFALNLAPCEDNVVLDSEVKTEILQSLDNDHQHQDLDICSPFCSCQCCHITAKHFQLTHTKLDIHIISTQDFLYLKGNLKDFSKSILQPPQV